MSTTQQILQEFEKLPTRTKWQIVERALQILKEEEDKAQFAQAVGELRQDYVSNTELTAFTALDMDEFYEPK